MLFKNKRIPKLKFMCAIPEIANVFPITPAKKIQREWVEKALKQYREWRQEPDFGHKRIGHISKCPGIFKVNQEGWVVRACQDVSITPVDDGKKLSVVTASALEKLGHPLSTRYIDFHNADQFTDFFVGGTGYVDTIFKVVTGWWVDIPEGYYLLMMPVPYADNRQFEAAVGILDGEAGPQSINIQCFWKDRTKRGIIEAGTPLAQMILVKKDQDVEVAIGEMTSEEEREVMRSKTIATNKFVSNNKQREKVWKNGE